MVFFLISLAFRMAAPSAEPTAILQWEGRMKSPSGLTFDRNRLFVADTGNDRILVFSKNFAFVRRFGSTGEGDGQLKRPRGLSIDPDGNLIIADSGNNRIVVVTPEGEYVRSFGSSASATERLKEPSHAIADMLGRMLVADTGNHRIAVFSPTGDLIKTVGGSGSERNQFNEPRALAFVKDHAGKQYVLVANGSSSRVDVYEYSMESVTLTHVPLPAVLKPTHPDPGQIEGFSMCGGVAADSTGNVFAISTNTGEAKKFRLGEHREAVATFTGGVFGRMNHPAAVGVGPMAKVAIADTGNHRVIVLDYDLNAPRRPRVTVLSDTSAAIEWNTPNPGVGALLYRATKGPQKYAPMSDEPQYAYQRSGDPNVSAHHRAILTNLQPGTAYRVRVHYSGSTVLPGGARSMEFAFATRPPAKKMTTLRVPIAVIVYANVVNLEYLPGSKNGTGRGVRREIAPGVSSEYIEYVKQEIEKGRMFFWVNSGMRVFLDVETFVSEKPITVGMGAPPGQYDWRKDLNRLLMARGKSLKDFSAAIEITCERRWKPLPDDAPDEIRSGPLGQLITKNPHGIWTFEGSGGGTYGADMYPGSSHFLGGSDITWLFVHEFHHQFDSQFAESGYPEYPFNHFAREDAGGFAAHFGEHYDGNAWILRHWPCVLSGEHAGGDNSTRGQCVRYNGDAFLFDRFGDVILLDDKDEDGFPDDFPLVPLDEARFGSDPNNRDSDKDGIDDRAEAMTSIWAHELLPAVSNASAKHVRPDPRNADADGDGVPDGSDPYPLYAAVTEIRRVSADIIEAWSPFCAVEETGVNDSEPARSAILARWDNNSIGFKFHFNRRIEKLHLQLDCNNDGYYVGKDNVDVRIEIEDGKAVLRDVSVTNAAIPKKWPFTDHDLMSRHHVEVRSKDDLDGFEVEVFVLKNEAVGLAIKQNQIIGVNFDFLSRRDTDHWISVFEPYSLFQLKLID